ncbi:MAG: hypothetical protein US60_C0016G0010 [Microgenomates group bacterium GW2011_GWC1_37_8]|uniref:DUF2029 domain-containing protein n=1 Tax=Candidatus Woesebacteria bacterium GW2011_GWB1_38_8 TaxID=1618570 RepID=A0A0G0L133_9BACT|nr:MAG: hypothetical protein US60_C0016G0010 [Microgenomates group bacterium GW2011_GWC1_37_8]KKQ85648.1 MAG: hypothetical protein UT08_C0005G0099 [Candidatus Woesebacteria bacterium GW2011_GWB1_38_8]
MISVARRRYLSLVFVTSFFLALLGVIFFVLSFKDAVGSDFVSFLTGAKILESGNGENLYDFRTQFEYQKIVTKPLEENSLLPYVNVPILALLLVPLTDLSLLNAFKLYTLLILVVVVSISLLVKKIFENLSSSYWLLLPFVFYPSIGSVFVGQITQILVLVLLLVYKFVRERKAFISGILCSLLMVKFQYLIFSVYIFILVKDRKKYLSGLLLGLVIIFTLSMVLTNGALLRNYLDFVFAMQKPEYGTRMEEAFTLFAFLSQQYSLSFWQLFLTNFIFYIFSIGAFLLLAKKLSYDRVFAIAIIFTLIFCVHGVNYDYAISIIPIFILINKLKSNIGLEIGEKISLFILLMAPVFFVIQKSFYVSFLLLATAIFLIKEHRNNSIIEKI